MGKKGKNGKKGKGSGGTGGHYLSPGVYVEEVPSAGKPIEAVGTAVAAFVGFSPFSLPRVVRTVAVASAVVVLVRKIR